MNAQLVKNNFFLRANALEITNALDMHGFLEADLRGYLRGSTPNSAREFCVYPRLDPRRSASIFSKVFFNDLPMVEGDLRG